jgi:hypothetical protein
MSLEAAAVAVGQAVGKQLVLAWEAGQEAERRRDADLSELIQARFPDRIVRRRFSRQIDDVADQVAERLLSLCGHEYLGLTENDRAATVTAVADTLAGAGLSDRELFAADLDAGKLAGRVRALGPGLSAEQDLGEAGARLYDVVLEESCGCLLRIAQQLPEYGPRASTESLARLSGLAEQVALILERLPVRTLDAPEGTAGDESFGRRYSDHVSGTLDVLELFGVRIERYRPRTTLSVAYISLSVSTDAKPGRRGGLSGQGQAGFGLEEWRSSEPESGEATLRVETALGQAPLTLIRGEAGSGKSTLLRWLAISAARGRFTGDLAGWNGCVPFLIKLRSHTGRPLPAPERFLEGVADPVAGLMPAGWVHRQLRGGRALLLVDGVDELPAGQRRAVRPWLSGLLAEYPGLRAVVTSRPAAAGSGWLAAEGFATAFLERMSPADVRELIRHWHAAVRDAGDLPCPAEQLPGFEAALLARMESAPHLRALAGSPLLAAMLCALNLDREKQLPRDRMGLYAAALELLLERRDVERQIQADGGVTLERAQKTQILQDLAWRLSITGRTELPKQAVIGWVGQKLATMPAAPADAAGALEHLLVRSGVLREPVDGRIDFVHRTVQEYLTAKQFAEDGDLEPLIEAAHKDQWRETIIMTAGHANAPQRAELLAGLLGRVASEPQRAYRLKLLVVSCLETLATVPAGLRADVEACADDLIPPRDLNAARSLSNVGQPILDRLPRASDGLTAAQARAVVRTAWLINGPEALDLLAGYGRDEREIVQEELVKGWEYFDTDVYARRVLADLPLVGGHLDVPAPHLLPGARHLTHLRSLVSADGVLADLSFLSQLRQPLKRLSIPGLQSGDLRPLTTHAESLETVFIGRGTLIRDIEPILRLRKLTALTVPVTGRTDIEFIKALPQLNVLGLHNMKSVGDLSPISAQRALIYLVLSECHALREIDSFPPLDKVVHLAVNGSSLETGLADLVRRTPRLRYFFANRTAFANNLAPLASLQLTNLGLWGCQGITDFGPLAGLTSLHWLDLEGTAIRDLTPLGELAELQTLWIRHCAGITDLSPLASLRNLEALFIAGIAPGTDLAPLASLPRLTVYIGTGQDVRNRKMLGRRVDEYSRAAER